MANARKFAVFDIDWTMHPAALGTNFIHQLLLDGVVKADFDIERTYAMWRENPGEIFMSHYRDLYKTLIGLPEKSLRPVAEKVGVEAARNLYDFAQTELERLKTENRFIVLISNSPSMTVESFAKAIGADEYAGGDFEFDNEGKLHTMHSTHDRLKSNELQRIVAIHDLDFEDSYGYGDSMDDVSMLELVDHPVAVSPKADLEEVAKERGWRIVDVG